MTAKEIHLNLLDLVSQGRKIDLKILEHLRGIERRMYYAELGYPTLYEYARHQLKFSEDEAYRRIQASRALADIPEAKVAYAEGKVTASTLSQLQNYSRKNQITKDEKLQLFQEIQDKSKREVEKILRPEVDEDEFHELFEEIKAIYSHQAPYATLKDLFVILAREKLQRGVSGPARKCEYADPKTGKACGSKFFLEKDHIHPKALGGSNDQANLRTYCRAHNQLAAVQVYGKQTMQRYIPRLR